MYKSWAIFNQVAFLFLTLTKTGVRSIKKADQASDYHAQTGRRQFIASHLRGFFVSGANEFMARSEVITPSRAGAEIPDCRCEAPSCTLHVKKHSIFVPVPQELFKQQRYDDALRAACDALSALGVQNYIHWDWDENNAHRVTLVELIGQPGLFLPVIHHTANSIELREHDLCDMR